ncbi:MAG: hypothetical protein BJ554DRAFT_7282, partial [Olpidium bornovanus]
RESREQRAESRDSESREQRAESREQREWEGKSLGALGGWEEGVLPAGVRFLQFFALGTAGIPLDLSFPQPVEGNTAPRAARREIAPLDECNWPSWKANVRAVLLRKRALALSSTATNPALRMAAVGRQKRTWKFISIVSDLY